MLRATFVGLVVLAALHGAGAAPVTLASGGFVTCQTPNGERYQASGECMAGDVIVSPCILPDGSARSVRSLRECDALHGRFGHP